LAAGTAVHVAVYTIRVTHGGPCRRVSGFQFNIENVGNRVYVAAKESAFTPGQYSLPRQFSGSLKVRF
jgi:hypothetical protein